MPPWKKWSEEDAPEPCSDLMRLDEPARAPSPKDRDQMRLGEETFGAITDDHLIDDAGWVRLEIVPRLGLSGSGMRPPNEARPSRAPAKRAPAPGIRGAIPRNPAGSRSRRY